MKSHWGHGLGMIIDWDMIGRWCSLYLVSVMFVSKKIFQHPTHKLGEPDSLSRLGGGVGLSLVMAHLKVEK